MARSVAEYILRNIIIANIALLQILRISCTGSATLIPITAQAYSVYLRISRLDRLIQPPQAHPIATGIALLHYV